MAEWSNATMTDIGADLQAKVNAGKTKLTFTKIKVGSGVNATNPLALTDVISSKWETTNFVVKQEGKIVSVDTFITNNGIKEAFRMSEIGLFANDPDKGEILYAYLTDPEPDRMPAEGGAVVVSQELSIGMMFSNTGNVSLTVNIGALVNQEQLNEHNSSISSHPPITDQIKAILGSTNWKDVPASTLVTIKNLLGQGAIVASKLDANAGFVKFANGFTIQWGRDNYDSDERSHWVTFPISFIECYSAVPSIIGGSSDSIKIYNINKTGFEKVSYYNFQTNKTVSRPCLWLAVGKA
ncbi:hypothetical protein FNLLGLLA_00430 [Veillonella parvula]|uniref:gp53-like domain-containing protein n=1 Tax=Veillonella parvula TaxID=29466 RepID=UPI0014513A89|nr:hypothetical protein [Veillonella parvula]CAB1274652.1 hypothetical protein FNLLGLLA_00430 [Veillonella parvula]